MLRSTTAPILNRVNRIRFGLAVASAVFDNASRRNPSIKVQARPESNRRNWLAQKR